MPRHEADRNLLFGIVALQMDFVARDDLIAAMNAWALAKHRPLGDLLVDRGAMTPSRRTLLEALVDEHVRQHGDDPARSLAAVGSAGGVISDLKRSLLDTEIRESLGHTVPPGDPGATRMPGVDDGPSPRVRYRKVRDHARGGLGVVFVAVDEELNREVALKEIQEQYADDPHSRSRFVVEAEVTGGLEHPGIVPVYGLGHDATGRPFYAMRFIRGHSFQEAIARFHGDEKPGRTHGERSLALHKLLRRFLDVCNAVEYAHSRGVLHRDLKPDNIMVGKFGETLVVDWGLAKATGRPGDNDDGWIPEAPLIPSSGRGIGTTQPGSTLGTPAYMPPELADGRLDLLGPSSDVYSLGATLYYLLTGRPPYEDRDLGSVLQKVRRGEFPPPRQVNRGVAPPLEVICTTAMALRPEERYKSPDALAEDLERWMADEAITARPDRPLAAALRWSRHRPAIRTWILALIIADALLLLVWAGLFPLTVALDSIVSLPSRRLSIFDSNDLEIYNINVRLKLMFRSITSLLSTQAGAVLGGVLGLACRPRRPWRYSPVIVSGMAIGLVAGAVFGPRLGVVLIRWLSGI